jgi:threonine/homoserine/homoserine lactone efflux protein
VLGIVYLAIALVVDTSYVLTASALSRRFLQKPAAQIASGRIAAVTYIGLGIAAAALGYKPSSG